MRGQHTAFLMHVVCLARRRRLLGITLLAGVLLALPAREAHSHWCHDLWASSYNLVLRPASDVVDVPTSGSTTLDVWVQNNMGYPLRSFALTAQASGYTINVGRQASKVSGYLMPGEKLLHTLTISSASGTPLAVESIEFFVSFGSGGQSAEYPQVPGGSVMIKKADGTVWPPTPSGLGQGWDQAAHLASSALANYGDLNQALDDLLQEYCAGRASWDHNGLANQTTYCPNVSATTCPPRQTGNAGTKWDWQKLWSAQELAYRKSALGPRLGVLRERLRCGWNDVNLPFRAFPLFVLGYLGEDAAARTFIEGIIASGSAEEQTIAKAALLLFRNAQDRTQYRADVVAGTSSSNGYVAAACAAALGIVDGDDAAVEQVLLPNAQWVEPDTADNGEAFYVSHLLAIVVWDRRGWAVNAGDLGAVTFYGDNSQPPVDTTAPQAPANVRCTASAGGAIRVSWSQVTRDVNNGAESVSQYRVYWGNASGDRAHVDATGGTFQDYTSLDGTATYYYSVVAVDAAGNASAVSSETSCVPVYAPVARIACNPLSGAPPLHVDCNGDQSSDPNGSADLAAWAFSLDGGAEQAGPQVGFDFPQAGGHVVLLRVTDQGGLTHTAQANITVQSPGNALPTARAAANPTTGQAPLTVDFSSAGSTDPDANQTLAFVWDFRDGTSSTEPNPTHTFQNAGTYDVLLTATDDGSPAASATAMATVEVTGNRPPDTTGAAVSPTSGRPPLLVHFDASGVRDPDGNQVAITWSFGDGSADSTQRVVDHTYATAGTYNVTLSAQDDGTPAIGPVTQPFVITVDDAALPTNRAPDCANASVTPSSGTAPLHVVLDATGCTDPDGHQLTFLWRIPTSYTTEETFTTPRAEFHLPAAGTTAIHLLVRDDAAQPMETSREFSVVVAASTGRLELAERIGGGCSCRATRAPGSGSQAWILLLCLLSILRRRT